MRVLVDSSAWVDFFNGHASPQGNALARLIRQEADVLTCGLVAVEVLQGIRQSKGRAQVEKHFLDMEWLTPREPETYLDAATLFRKLRSRGITIRSTIDCVIAGLAHENDALLLSKDRDLQLIIESEILDIRSLPLA